jgi:hypothetical protein
MNAAHERITIVVALLLCETSRCFSTMTVRWIPFAFCTEGGFVGWTIVTVLAYYKYAWFLLAGMAQSQPKLWLMFVLLYGQVEELFFNWIFAYQFPQQRPECTLEYDETFEVARNAGMPSLETQMSFALSSFVLGHFITNKDYPSHITILTVVALPLLVAGGLYATSNNTALQIVVGAGLGSFNGIKRILLYHFFAKEALMIWLHRFSFLTWIFPAGD